MQDSRAGILEILKFLIARMGPAEKRHLIELLKASPSAQDARERLTRLRQQYDVERPPDAEPEPASRIVKRVPL